MNAGLKTCRQWQEIPGILKGPGPGASGTIIALPYYRLSMIRYFIP